MVCRRAPRARCGRCLSRFGDTTVASPRRRSPRPSGGGRTRRRPASGRMRMSGPGNVGGGVAEVADVELLRPAEARESPRRLGEVEREVDPALEEVDRRADRAGLRRAPSARRSTAGSRRGSCSAPPRLEGSRSAASGRRRRRRSPRRCPSARGSAARARRRATSTSRPPRPPRTGTPAASAFQIWPPP